MTSRFAKSVMCLNGPKEGNWIDAPPGVDVGTACAVPWVTINGQRSYAVYVVTLMPDADPSDDAPHLGLMYIESHRTPEQAQGHVERLSLVIQAGRQVGDQN